MIYQGLEISQALISDMRDWAKDCNWRECEDSEDVESFINELSDTEIVQGIDANYTDGVQGFINDSI